MSEAGAVGRTAARAADRRRFVRLNEWARGAWRPLACCVAANLAGSLALIAQAWLLAGLVATAIAGQSLLDRGTDIAWLAGIYLLRAALSQAAEAAGFEAAAGIRGRLRAELAAHLVRLGPSYTKLRETGALAATLLEKVDALDGFFARYLPQLFAAASVPLAVAAAAATVDWRIALGLLASAPLLVLFMALIGRGALAASEGQMQVLARMGGYFLDRLRGLATLRVLGQADAEAGRIAAVAEDFRRRTMKVLRIAFLTSTVLELFAAGAIAGVAIMVALGLLDVLQGGPGSGLTLAGGLFLLLLAPDFFLPLRQLALHYHDRAGALAAAEALVAILDAPAPGVPAAPVRAPRADGPPALGFDGVQLDYGGGRIALAGGDLAVAAGETVALAGPSGAGKSTVIELLLGFEQPTAGRILVDGLPLGAATLRRSAAWIGQSTRLLHGTLADNIRLARPDATAAEVEDAARRAGVMDFASRLPDGLDTPVGESGHGLSGGEAQRVAVARAFLADALLVLLDEPTAHLVADSAARLPAALGHLAAGRTVIAASHDPTVLALADRVVMLARGRTVGAGGHA